MNRSIVALVDDLFWRAKIDHAARSAGSTARFISEPSELAGLTPQTTSVVVVDLSLRKLPFEAIAGLKAAESSRGLTVIGFYEHVRKDLREKGLAAGCDDVYPRAGFAERLADIVLRYAHPGGVRAESEETELPEE